MSVHRGLFKVTNGVISVQKVIHIIKEDTVLAIAWILAVLTMFLVPPSMDYLGYVDFHTLALLFALMAVMAGLQGLGLFRSLGESMLNRTRTTRQLETVLLFLPFLSSMIVTNDVALITFVPFALEVLRMAGLQHRIIPVVAMQTIAANLGSMTTPIGNPQNLYLYSRYSLSLGDFFSTMLPLTAGAAVLLVLFLLLTPSKPLIMLPIDSEAPAADTKRRLYAMYGALFLLCLCAVAKILSVWAAAGIVFAAVFFYDQRTLRAVDYNLLLTFVGFFLFVGNLGALPVFRNFFESILLDNELLCSVAVSQVISNVPAALLLSGFTDNARGLLIGTNLGGLGTLIASMASLISFKALSRVCPGDKGRYLVWFTLSNIVFLIALLGLQFLLGGLS